MPPSDRVDLDELQAIADAANNMLRPAHDRINDLDKLADAADDLLAELRELRALVCDRCGGSGSVECGQITEGAKRLAALVCPCDCKQALVLERDRLTAENAKLRQWQRDVASGLGYLNQPDGQDGYEVADPDVILAANRDLRWETEGAEAERDRLRDALERILRAANANECATATEKGYALAYIAGLCEDAAPTAEEPERYATRCIDPECGCACCPSFMGDGWRNGKLYTEEPDKP